MSAMWEKPVKKAWDSGCPKCTEHEKGVYMAYLEADKIRQEFHHVALRAHLEVAHQTYGTRAR